MKTKQLRKYSVVGILKSEDHFEVEVEAKTKAEARELVRDGYGEILSLTPTGMPPRYSYLTATEIKKERST